jgi:hypothetical protein
MTITINRRIELIASVLAEHFGPIKVIRDEQNTTIVFAKEDDQVIFSCNQNALRGTWLEWCDDYGFVPF